MTWTDLLPPLPSLKMDSIQQEGRQMLITLVSTRESDQCPTCQTNSQAGHGWYTRRIQSLPCSGRAVMFLIRAAFSLPSSRLSTPRPFEKTSPPLLTAISAARKR